MIYLNENDFSRIIFMGEYHPKSTLVTFIYQTPTPELFYFVDGNFYICTHLDSDCSGGMLGASQIQDFFEFFEVVF